MTYHRSADQIAEDARRKQIGALQHEVSALKAENAELRARLRSLPNGVHQPTPTSCFRACVATVLNVSVDDVPLACDGDSWDWDAFQRWLASRGLQAVEIGFANGGTIYPVQSPVRCIVTGPSTRPCPTGRHAVVGSFIGMDGFTLDHDPHVDSLWIDGEPTHAVFFVPLNANENAELRQRLAVYERAIDKVREMPTQPEPLVRLSLAAIACDLDRALSPKPVAQTDATPANGREGE